MNEPQVAREMPKYKSHKEVWALKIARIEHWPSGGATIYPAEAGYAPFVVDGAYIAKHAPFAEGYYVVYKGGYKSFSPADVFEEGYTLIS